MLDVLLLNNFLKDITNEVKIRGDDSDLTIFFSIPSNNLM